jgi:hypothetical protein
MVFERNRKRTRSRHSARASFMRQFLWGLGLITVLSGTLFGIYHGTRMETFTLRTVTVTGGATIPASTIEQRVLGELRGSYWRLVPYAFALTYPHDRMVRALQEHPRLREIVIHREGFSHLAVHFEEYIPHALLCAADAAQTCYFIDAHGFAFEEAPAREGGALVRYIEEDRERVARGDRVAEDRLRTAEAFMDAAETQLDFRIGTVTYTASNDILFGVNGGGVLKISGARDSIDSFSNIQSVLETKEYTHITPGSFQYIDARFPPKIFVNETTAPIATTTELDAASSTIETDV